MLLTLPKNVVNIQTLLAISKRSLKEVAYLYKLMEVAGSHANWKFYR